MGVVDWRGTAVRGRTSSGWSAFYVRDDEAFPGEASESNRVKQGGSNRVKQGGSTVSDAVTSTGGWGWWGRGQKKKASDGGRLSRGGVRRGGVFPIRPEVACSTFSRLRNDKMFAQAAQWRFAGDLIRRTYRRWNQPAKIAVAKPNSSPGPTRHALSLLDQQNHK
jgi:hypothetical protein